MSAAFAEFKERISEINDLERAGALLRWDQQMIMPPRGGEVRAEQLGTLGGSPTRRSPRTRSAGLLEELAPVRGVAAVRLRRGEPDPGVRREWEKERRVPAELAAEIARSNSLALPLWVEARQKSDFSIFLPALRRNLELRRRYIECFDGRGYDEPYDVLLDDFEPGMKTAEVRDVFARLKEAQVPLVAAVRRDGERPARGRAVPDRAAEGVRAEGGRAVRLRPQRVAARHGRASVRDRRWARPTSG